MGVFSKIKQGTKDFLREEFNKSKVTNADKAKLQEKLRQARQKGYEKEALKLVRKRGKEQARRQFAPRQQGDLFGNFVSGQPTQFKEVERRIKVRRKGKKGKKGKLKTIIRRELVPIKHKTPSTYPLMGIPE